MKILYAVQGTGNGHLSRAKEIYAMLNNRVEVDVLISGTQYEIDFDFPVKFRCRGIVFVFGKNGGIDYLKTLKANNIFKIIKEIRECNLSDYDLIINDFEPITAWASYFRGDLNCISLSHQGAFVSKKVPKPKKPSIIGKLVLKYFAPSTTRYSFHFKSYDKNIFTPIIRNDIRRQSIKQKNYYIVYLPFYSDEKISKVLSKIKGVKWKVFSKHSKEAYSVKNVKIKPIANSNFERAMAWSSGVICGAGFETPAEAMYLKKKLLVVPMKNQYEQACNAESLKELGVLVLPSFNKKMVTSISEWIEGNTIIDVDFPDRTQFIIDEIITNHIVATELSERLLQNI
ncbi:glycosyl transferase [Yeosuana aromativorans]|uniref:Glycosyl transferase n=1 Tax=Yeosuana aromativorans TaxID=288019 RepID=A0A8J3FD90_9FLAO|nr:glycosyltransferase family protein [Yeosuana aromativorans]GGK11834.1 glycosyl transferase [Yeosuana aromativorans]